jgi:membrane protein DedA with SNARE-associated domain
MSEWFSTMIDWYMVHISYGTVVLMMAIESSFLPLPSEVVIPPAAWKAAEGALNPFMIVLCGVTGSLIGALFNYFFARTLGRAIIYRLADTKIAHLMMIDKEAVEKAEAYFIKYGNSATFIGRLVPGIRHLISIPAGLAKMKLGDFVMFTALGAGIWTAILTALGYLIYSQQELLEKYYTELKYALYGLGVVFVIYLIYRAFRKNGAKENQESK